MTRKKIHRFIVPFTIENENALVSDPGVVWQVTRVLKLREGEEVIVCDGTGNELSGEIVGAERDTLRLRVVRRITNDNEPRIRVTLYCAALKHENFEFVAQKAVEVGVHEIVPLITERTVKQSVRTDRIQRIMKEAAELSGRAFVPELREMLPLREALRGAKESKRLFFDVSGNEELNEESAAVGVWIGPEGGWTDDELALARAHRCAVASLGKLILRAETAAAIAVYNAVRG